MKLLLRVATVFYVVLMVTVPASSEVQAQPTLPAVGTTERVSVADDESQGNNDSVFPSISPDGRYVTFHSSASNLVTGDTNFSDDVFVRDRMTGATERVSVATDGTEGNDFSRIRFGATSADGRFVAFFSLASNLVAVDTNALDVFVRDRQSGTTELVSVSSDGIQGNGDSINPAISADGRYVAFLSHASNLVSGDTNNLDDIFVRDRQNGTTERISVAYDGSNANGVSKYPSLSADGRFVAFNSFASNLLGPGLDTNAWDDVFVRDRLLGTTERVSVSSSESQQNFASQYPTISADAQFVVFLSFSTNLVSGDTNNAADIFVRYRATGTTERVSLANDESQANAASEFSAISADGRFVAFSSAATNLVGGDTNTAADIFLRDRLLRTTERLSVASDGSQGNGESSEPAISADGQYIAFRSNASNLIAVDTNAFQDIFVRDRGQQLPLLNTYIPIVNR